MNNPAFVAVSHSSVTTSQPNQILFPGSLSLPPGIIPYSDHTLFTVYPGNHLLERTGSGGNRYHGGRRVSILKGDPKVLGVIQILIALIHWGFGSVLTLLPKKETLIIVSGYVYWGGLFYVISGSLMVAAERIQLLHLVKAGLGMNIMSTIAAATGAILFLMDENVLFSVVISPQVEERKVAQGLSNVLLIFTLLEFFIGLASSSFEYDVICHQSSEATPFVPEAAVIHQDTFLPLGPPPPYEEHVNTINENLGCSNQIR
ncbi:hypothetical protein JRQ81_000168 [Phrynocephalus forsythii]|uniref:Membrane-spanning 4-domains subfamily A member 15 n=1 Tax=Phrynocephalus forsythii TaxID=171643 RepID=A0A9Q0Y896_9SAUR|nr:hypothetical protein JRQ81_000168 [Phrynocephalus forsythii]